MERYERFKAWAQQNPNLLLFLSLGFTNGLIVFVGAVFGILAGIAETELLDEFSAMILSLLIWFTIMLPISDWALEIKGRSKWWLLLLISWIGVLILILIKNNNAKENIVSNRS
ncbi:MULTISPECIES: hypothetical protein [Methanosarcina]|uniref:Uncharacterized protein n=3 Tax=Methanosarcina barkeri TaxID=2208 RepID=A0A0E3QX31_METBA|nr:MULTISPECIES: hypothetical protein [Methanosarcina]AKB55324.1 hypothetical protein MSBRM_2326 [Methanosarcina barkeri MS]AKB56602.1 hypothetical protein MSBR2_0086 [Methanosarcina barkeri 227]AKJ37182.1 hypothetical protein MCM1_0056 [Methanosarcina barkeri CM1]OED01892.1 hypothetical protein A9239_14835 [Methanosarcina sp. A14]